MSEIIHMLIIEPSFIVREGVKTLFSQMGLAYRVDEVETLRDNLPRLIEKFNPQLLLVNQEQLFRQWAGNRSSAGFSGLIIAGICYGEMASHHGAHVDFSLNIHSPKPVIMQQMQEMLQKSGLVGTANESESISERETEVLRFVALGLTNNEISEKLYISVHTVMTHRKNITRKLGIKTVSGLTVYAILNKIVEAGELKGSSRE